MHFPTILGLRLSVLALAFFGVSLLTPAPQAQAALTLPSFSSGFPSCSLNASPTSVQKGQSVTLSWTSRNASSASLSPSVGTVATSGSLVVTPSATTQYILSVKGSGVFANFTSRCTRSVRVTAPVVPSPTCTLSANPSKINDGGSSNLTLTPTNAVSATINQGIGSVSTTSTTSVTPTATTTYTATVANTNNVKTTCSATVAVVKAPTPPPAPAPTCSLTATPSTIQAGQSSTLSWSSTNALSATMSGIGSIALNGSTNVTPNTTTTYTATFTGANNQSKNCSATVTVNPITPPPSGDDNLVQNGTFESVSAGDTGTPESWSRGGWGTNDGMLTYPVEGDGSAKAAQVSMTTHSSGDVKWVFAPVPVIAGKTYTYTDRYKATVPTNLTIEYTKNGGAKEYVWMGDAESASGWTAWSGSFTVPAGVVAATVFHVLAQPGVLTIDNVVLKESSGAPSNAFNEGMVTFVFDDGLTSQKVHAVPMLNAAGYKGTFAIITSEPDNGNPDYMTWDEIGALRDQGHEVGGHSRTHAHLTQISATAQDAEIKGSFDDLVARGFSPKTFVYPYGEQDAMVRSKVQSAGYIGARGVYLGYNTKSSDRYLLSDQHLESNTTVADAKGFIDTARTQKSWLIFEIHEQSASAGQYANNPEVLQGIIDYLKSTNTKVVTLEEGLGLMD